MRAERNETIQKLRTRFRRDRIEATVLDLDDFLLRTDGDAFGRQMDRFAGLVVAAAPEIPLEHMKRTVRLANKAVHQEMGVDPKRWQGVVHLLGDWLGDSMRPTLRQYLPTLLDIYHIIPRLVPGARTVVATLAEAAPVGINTHALTGWTGDKLSGTGLSRYVSFVHVVPVTQKHKEAKDWHAAARGLGTRPGRLLTGGDSGIADAVPSLEAGVKEGNVILVASAWGSHNSNGTTLPDGIMRPETVQDIIPKLIEGV